MRMRGNSGMAIKYQDPRFNCHPRSDMNHGVRRMRTSCFGFVLCGFLLCVSASLSAEDSLQKIKSTIDEIELIRKWTLANPEGGTITKPDGAEEFIDAAKVQEYQKRAEKKITELKDQLQALEAEKKFAIQAYGEVFSVVPGSGLLFQGFTKASTKDGGTSTFSIGDGHANISFISGVFPDAVDGDALNLKLYRTGTYSYTTVQGGVKTIPYYTTRAEEFVRYWRGRKKPPTLVN